MSLLQCRMANIKISDTIIEVKDRFNVIHKIGLTKMAN